MPRKTSFAPPSAARPISATEAVRNFGSILASVREERAVYVVSRSGTPVAELGPVAEPPLTAGGFAEFVRSGSAGLAGAEYLRAIEDGIARLNWAEVPGNPWER